VTLKLTNQEFDSCLLEEKLNFRLSEAARLVLVHKMDVDVAAGIVGLREEGDLDTIKEAVRLISKSHQDSK
jgi:hypothetical protein